jgi:uncharacterized protein (TIGR02145 family)
MKMKNRILFFVLFSLYLNMLYCQNPCGEKQTIAYGGLIYKIKAIGTQCWFAENLNTGTMIEGKYNQTNNNIIEKYCYDDDENNCRLYGALYQWDELMQYEKKEKTKGICPEEWRIASDNDFGILEKHLGMTQEMTDNFGGRGTNQGARLMHKGDSGFEASLGGTRNEDNNFYEQNVGAYIWTSTYDEANKMGIYRYLLMDSKQIYKDRQNTTTGFSVRCIKD